MEINHSTQFNIGQSFYMLGVDGIEKEVVRAIRYNQITSQKVHKEDGTSTDFEVTYYFESNKSYSESFTQQQILRHKWFTSKSALIQWLIKTELGKLDNENSSTVCNSAD